MGRALGRYELLRPLARGGMAEVYLARRRAAGIEKWLVVKRMRPERTGDPRFLDLFVREARLSMSLVHQNIVPVFDFGRIDDQVFLAMERVEGRDLGSSLARAPSHRLPPLLAAFIAAECCQALDYAHQRKGPDGVALGIVHRDVTPRNVLLSWSGEVKLTDFGIAALAGDATSRLIGTPQYMAPEQARSEPIDPRADIYSIGMVLREAVTGVRPRPGADRDAILDAARRGELLPWSHRPAEAELAPGSGDGGEVARPADAPPHAEDAPAALVAIIDRATALGAADRYPDARSMLEDLDAFILAERAAHKAESPARQLGSWLAEVWQGALDDAQADAAIEADHLVSFLDDGAIDVLGTGTMRSMALTAADEAQSDPLALAAVGPTTPAVPVAKATVVSAPAGPAAGKTATPPGGRPRIETPARLSRISSSTATIASGSFHTIPTNSELGRARTRGNKTRSLSPIVSLVLVAVAAGGLVFWVMTGIRERGPASTGPIAGPPGTPPPITGQPSTGQPSTGQPSTGQPSTGQPSTGQPSTGQPSTGQPST
ncbi:MAG TPA: protein kinase, partial [Kofleriaceae bacterium]